MQMPDVNVLVYAHCEESPDHQRYATWLTGLATGPEPSYRKAIVFRPAWIGPKFFPIALTSIISK